MITRRLMALCTLALIAISLLGATSIVNAAVPTGTPIPTPVYTLHSVVCTTAIYDRPGGQAIGAPPLTLKAGQSWFTALPVQDAKHQLWTPVYVVGRIVYVPTTCIR
ncbi:MAG: hypothetical protein ACYDBJ_22000 [Aggregatilineales bacterium]